jgi:hypothetical protein
MAPIDPGSQVCANCWYWTPGSANSEWCHAAMGYTDPTFHCQDWRGLLERTDPMTGDPWPRLEPAPSPPKD